jgi:hypothetical protein
MGYLVPPGISDATVPNPIFNLTPAATVDEGNNWININWGPLAMSNPVTNTPLSNYGPAAGSSVINDIPNAGAATANYADAPSVDFYGNSRKTNNAVDAGAIEWQLPPNTPLASVSPTSLTFASVPVGTTTPSQTLTVSNNGNANVTGITVVVTAPFARLGGTCVTATPLTPGSTCTITVTFTPTSVAPANGTATITSNVAVTGSPVALTGTGIAATFTATVSPGSLAFGNWATTTTSNMRNVTVLNTGNSALAGGTFTGIAAPFARVTSGTFPAGAPNCAATLAVGASCTIKVQYAPTAVVTSTGSLAVAYTGATVTGSPVALSGTGVATRATVSISPNPLTITLPSGTLSGTGTITLTNTAAAGGSNVSVTNVAVNGAGLIWAWTASGTNTCTGAALAPGATCTVGVQFGRILSVGTHTGAITFTDTGIGSPQAGVLTGIAQ